MIFSILEKQKIVTKLVTMVSHQIAHHIKLQDFINNTGISLSKFELL